MSGQETDSAPIDAICRTKKRLVQSPRHHRLQYSKQGRICSKIINTITVYDLHRSNPCNRIQLDNGSTNYMFLTRSAFIAICNANDVDNLAGREVVEALLHHRAAKNGSKLTICIPIGSASCGLCKLDICACNNLFKKGILKNTYTPIHRGGTKSRKLR
jgi:hypothetical protein